MVIGVFEFRTHGSYCAASAACSSSPSLPWVQANLISTSIILTLHIHHFFHPRHIFFHDDSTLIQSHHVVIPYRNPTDFLAWPRPALLWAEDQSALHASCPTPQGSYGNRGSSWASMRSKEDRPESSTQDSGGKKRQVFEEYYSYFVQMKDVIGRCLERI